MAEPGLEAPLLSGQTGVPEPERSANKKRMTVYINAMADGGEMLHPKLGAFIRFLGPFASGFFRMIMFVMPFYWKLLSACYAVYSVLPIHVLQMIFGFALCFFGGTYVTSIAAIEAFRTLGGMKLWDSLTLVYDEMTKVKEVIRKDSVEDKDQDGTADIEALTSTQLAQRSLVLGMKTVEKPEVLQTALVFLWTSWISVLATLKLQFAQTIALALGTADILKFPAVIVFAPPLTLALGPDLKHWVDTIIDTSLKIIAVMFAWYIKMVVSAFYSGLRGGRMFADGLFKLLEEKDMLKDMPDYLVPKPYDPDKTYLDEMIMYPLAAGGFLFQVMSGFMLPFPLNLVFLPLNIIEWTLRWEITWH